MKGSLHTDLFMHFALQKDAGLRRISRRFSHVFVLEVPLYQRTLLITGRCYQYLPHTRRQGSYIVQNAIDLAHVLGVAEPKVAILSAVETVKSKNRINDRCRGPLQNGGPRPNCRRNSRWAVGIRYSSQCRGGSCQESKVARCRRGWIFSWFRISNQETCWPNNSSIWGCSSGRNRSGRKSSDHPHESG